MSDNIKKLSYEHQMAIEAMKSQLIIVLVARLGGSIDIPATEIDATGDRNLAMSMNDGVFHFEVQKKGGAAS